MNKEKNVIEEKSINDINYELLKKQFPHAISLDEDGKYLIDTQKLQMSLDPSKANIKEDGYGLNWVGKKEAYHNAFSKNYKVLKPLKESSKNWDNTENILIKGDNIDALKILRHNYFEAIKMIYIDPPYNTKNDGFVYNDNFTATTAQTLEELGYDKEYIDYIENIQGAKTHSGWLSFMYPRLLLAKDLLKDDGVIFISIDDNEVAQLKLLCDEVFGEDNFVAKMVWHSTPGSNTGTNIITVTEYVFIYTKSKANCIFNTLLVNNTEKYILEDEYVARRGKFIFNKLDRRMTGSHYSDALNYPIEMPDGQMIYPGGTNYKNNEKWNYRWSKTKLQWGIDNGFIVFKKVDEKWNAYFKQYLKVDNNDEFIERSLAYQNILKLEQFNSTQGTKEIIKLLGKKLFDYPKPSEMIKYLMNICLNKTDIILDFFAGSGTTAHAVMDLNSSDGGARKFICVQWAEPTPLKSVARDEGYETIFDITKTRIDKAGQKIVENDLVNQSLDIGFRTFEIVEDQKQKIYQKSLDKVSQEDLLTMMQNPSIQSSEEILYNLFVAESLSLCTKYEELIKDKLYLASNVAFVLGDISSDELVLALSHKKECEYITIYSPNISDDKFTLELESNISKIGIKPDKLRFRG